MAAAVMAMYSVLLWVSGGRTRGGAADRMSPRGRVQVRSAACMVGMFKS
jgi:hypothetical protein